MSRLRVLSWNINWNASAVDRQKQVEVVRALAPDLFLVQEVKATTLACFAPDFSWSVFALGPNPLDRYWRARFGTAILGSARLTWHRQMLIAPTFFEVPGAENHYKANRFARRATVAEVSCQGGPHFFALSLHASPAAGDIGEHKPWFHAGVDRWLTSTELPWVFGIDANTPATDPADEDDIDWCWPATDTRPGEDQLLGRLRRHRGRDLWRSHLAARPELMEPILTERPNGPLAISYVLPSGPVRYDHLWATPEFRLRSLEYLEDVTASDHRPVLAELELRPIGT